MTAATSSPILRAIRRMADDHSLVTLPDQVLLQRFLAQRDEAAFHALLRRHGPMVLEVCRAVVPNEADAEDAFQSTFLVFARSARRIRKEASLASWLHGVAYRTALKAKAEFARRQKHEARAPGQQASEADDLSWREVRGVLHEELAGLAVRYRLPLVVCYLQGKTQDEAAGLLGLAKGTLRGRLERGRALLRARLVRRGLGLAAVLVAARWPAASAMSQVLPPLGDSLGKAATLLAAGQRLTSGLVSARVAALAEGVFGAMFMTKIKAGTLVAVAVVLLGLGGGLVWWPSPAVMADPRSQPGTGVPGKGRGDDNLKNTLLALDKHLWEASAKGDWREREKFLADDFVSVSVLGTYGKADSVEADKRLRCTDWKVSDAEVVRASGDVAVLTYRYSCKVRSSGGELLETREDYRVVYVWANRNGGWVLVFGHDDHGRKLVADGGRARSQRAEKMLELEGRPREGSQPGDKGKDLSVIKLKNRDAAEVANAVEKLLAGREGRDVRIIADPRSNSILFSESLDRVIDVRGLVELLDTPVGKQTP